MVLRRKVSWLMRIQLMRILQAWRQFDATSQTRLTVQLQFLWYLEATVPEERASSWAIDMAGGNPDRVASIWRSPSSNPDLEYVYLVIHTYLHLSVGYTKNAEDMILCHFQAFETIYTSVLSLAITQQSSLERFWDQIFFLILYAIVQWMGGCRIL